jgi:hypothetical protein
VRAKLLHFESESIYPQTVSDNVVTVGGRPTRVISANQTRIVSRDKRSWPSVPWVPLVLTREHYDPLGAANWPPCSLLRTRLLHPRGGSFALAVQRTMRRGVESNFRSASRCFLSHSRLPAPLHTKTRARVKRTGKGGRPAPAVLERQSPRSPIANDIQWLLLLRPFSFGFRTGALCPGPGLNPHPGLLPGRIPYYCLVLLRTPWLAVAVGSWESSSMYRAQVPVRTPSSWHWHPRTTQHATRKQQEGSRQQAAQAGAGTASKKSTLVKAGMAHIIM